MRRSDVENFLKNSKLFTSVTFVRASDQRFNLCPTCQSELSRHNRQWICDDHGVVATPIRRKGVLKGETQTIQGRCKNTRKATKNWTEVEGGQGQRFNAPDEATAKRIMADSGLVEFYKVSKTGNKEIGGWRVLKIENIVAINGELVTD